MSRGWIYVTLIRQSPDSALSDKIDEHQSLIAMAGSTTEEQRSDRFSSDKTNVEETPSHNTSPPITNDGIVYPTRTKLILIVASLCMCVFLVALDQTIIAPALGTITNDFKSVKDIGWYGASYLLTTTALQPMYGTIFKLFNVKLAYLTAVFIFEIGSLISAVAPSSTTFIVGRAVAGIGTAGLFSGSIVILSLSSMSALPPSK